MQLSLLLDSYVHGIVEMLLKCATIKSPDTYMHGRRFRWERGAVPPKFEVRPMNSSPPVFHRNTLYHKKCPHPSQGILVIAFRSRKSTFHRKMTKKIKNRWTRTFHQLMTKKMFKK